GLLLAVVAPVAALVGDRDVARLDDNPIRIDLRVSRPRPPREHHDTGADCQNPSHISVISAISDVSSSVFRLPSSVFRYDLLTNWAAAALLPFLISLISAIVSCSSETFCRRASKSVSRAATLAGSALTAARFSAIA